MGAALRLARLLLSSQAAWPCQILSHFEADVSRAAEGMLGASWTRAELREALLAAQLGRLSATNSRRFSEDVLADARLRIYERWESFRGAADAVLDAELVRLTRRGYFLKTARNLAIDSLRRVLPGSLAEDEATVSDAADDPEEAAVWAERLERLRQALRRLPHDQVAMLVTHCTVASLALEANVCERTIRRRMRAAQDSLIGSLLSLSAGDRRM